MTEADALIRDGDASQNKLRPLRLRMASTITSFQFALNAKLTAMAGRTDGQAADLHRVAAEWAALSTEFRAFTGLIQTPAAPPWPDYVAQARIFMRRFHDQMRRVGKIVPRST